MTNLTELEKKVLVHMINEGCDCNGATTMEHVIEDNMTYTDVSSAAADTSLSRSQVKGVMSSLLKKGLILSLIHI